MAVLQQKDLKKITAQRKIELAILAHAVTQSYDDYYCDQDQADFDGLIEELEGDDEDSDEFYQQLDKAVVQQILRQREIGFDNFKQEAIQNFQTIQSSEELHSLMDNFNFDDGTGLLIEIIKNPYCALATAQKIYWLCMPTDFYEEVTDLANYPKDGMGYEVVELMRLIEDKAKNHQFIHDPNLDNHDLLKENHIMVQIETSKKYPNMPLIL